MRVLFVTPRFPGAAHRGDQIRSAALIRHLSRDHEITLLSAEAVDAASPAFAMMRAHCHEVEQCPSPTLARLARVAAALPSRLPLQVALHADPRLAAVVRRRLAGGDYDLVHLQLARLGELVDACGDVPVVVDFVDALSDNMRLRADAERGPARVLFSLEAGRLGHYERKLAATTTACVISAERDAAVIGGANRPVVVPNGIDLERMSHVADQTSRRGLVFVANWAYFPNRHGLRWLIDQVWPLVRDAVQDASLDLIGRDPEAIRFVDGCPGVRVLGAVDSVVPALHRAAVAVAPLHVGTGQSLKVLEAMACGAVVVTSPAVANALGPAAHDAVEVADGGPAFAAAIIRLLRDPARRGELSAAARGLVEQGHDWRVAAAGLDRVWRAAAAGRNVSDARPPAGAGPR